MNHARAEIRAWLEANCPPAMRTPMPDNEGIHGGRRRPVVNADAVIWLERAAAKGWTVPHWPTEYGGAGMSQSEMRVLIEEMRRIRARPPLLGMGVSMIGPTLLEYGTAAQKLTFLPPIARGETLWCQGYSEPGAGSDLASLSTRADDHGDHFLINGSKIWTSGAHHADWIFCLVRTDPHAPKQKGISFILIDMTSPGITVKPITLIDGNSHFCQVFFDDVAVPKAQLVHRLNDGWTVGKRLLQHERSGLDQLLGTGNDRTRTTMSLADLAKHSVGVRAGRIKDPQLRERITAHNMNARAYALTQARVVEESQANTPGAATSIFKLRWADLTQEQLELQLACRGTKGLGWSGVGFEAEAIAKARLWLEAKAASIAGGSNEVQRNIIAKRVLNLPD
ncbi:MAG: acyl-CoA dehydrogenase [Gammaproteobacteria bacterium]|nr:acyl-CoA dehydrogenase [Gammaproteobacteria bacterium]